MHCTPIETIKAASKAHRCTWCGQQIDAGTEYVRWTSYDDCAFANKMHPECLDACREEGRYWGENEYTPYDNERPTRAAAEIARAADAGGKE